MNIFKKSGGSKPINGPPPVLFWGVHGPPGPPVADPMLADNSFGMVLMENSQQGIADSALMVIQQRSIKCVQPYDFS